MTEPEQTPPPAPEEGDVRPDTAFETLPAAEREALTAEDPARFSDVVELTGLTPGAEHESDVIAVCSDVVRTFPDIVVEQLDNPSDDGFVRVRLHGGSDLDREAALTSLRNRR